MAPIQEHPLTTKVETVSFERTNNGTSAQSIAVSLVQSVGLIDKEGIGGGTSVGFGVGLVDSEGESVGERTDNTNAASFLYYFSIVDTVLEFGASKCMVYEVIFNFSTCQSILGMLPIYFVGTDFRVNDSREPGESYANERFGVR